MYLNNLKKLLVTTKCAQAINVRLHSVQANLLWNMLGVPHNEAQMYVKENRLDTIDTIRLADLLKFFAMNKYDVDSLLLHPKLFKLCENLPWEQYFLYLKECGFENVSPTHLLDCKKIRLNTVAELKKTGDIPKDLHLAETLVQYLDPRPPDDIIDDVKSDDLKLAHVHTVIVRRYLMYRLELTEEDIKKLTRIYRNIYNKSLQNLCESINLAMGIGFTKEKLFRNGYVLSTQPRFTREVLETIPDFVGTSMKVQMRSYPKLMGISLQNILRIYDILKNENISDELIKRTMNIFTLSPHTVKTRLNEIKQMDETRLLMNHPQVLNLVVHFNRTKTRLSFLQQTKLKCTSVLVLGLTNEYFENHVKEGKDVTKWVEVQRFLKKHLKLTDGSEVDFRRHPYYLYVPLVDIEDTYMFLKKKSYSNRHIANAIQILLYPKDKIEEVFKNMKANKMVESRKSRILKIQELNLALYFLEKGHHFNGNGIWRKNDDDDFL